MSFITSFCSVFGMSSDDCIFCKIVRGEIPSSVIFEDDICMAFLDVFPVNKGHSLLIPKKHYVNFLDVDSDVVAHMARRLIDLTRGVKNATGEEGVMTVVANGAGAGQEVPHLHFHAIPRSKGADFGFRFPPNYRESMANRTELDEISKKIRSAI
ncbi:MAG: HIT family protein [Candidatus Thorarchaeota archaeon]|nr:MAG: HIT family protein [Candidatus Thorarchaeota archaeon]